MATRLLYGLITGLATFALGLSLSWNARRPISLCELDANPEAYAGKTIRFRAVVDRTRNYITAGSVCRNGEVAGVSIELNPADAAKFPLPVSLKSLDENKSKTYLMDAEVVGQLHPYFGMGCFGPKYHVFNASVERIFSIRQFVDADEELQWFKSNSY